MNVRDLLPIGSVVLLNNGKKRVMIFGVKQTDNESGMEYDYIGVLYPEGNIGEVGPFLFDHDDIAKVFFKGFEEEERERFIENLAKFYESREET